MIQCLYIEGTPWNYRDKDLTHTKGQTLAHIHEFPLKNTHEYILSTKKRENEEEEEE